MRTETGRVNRRTFLIGAGAVLLAGCAKTQPSDGTSAEPSSQSSGAGPVAATVAVESSATGALLGALLHGAAQRAEASGTVLAAGDDWLDALGAGRLAAVPIWATTVWNKLSDDEEPPADVLADLAGLVGDSVRVLAPGSTDGGVVWMVARDAPVKALDDLGAWAKGKQAAVPAMAIDRTDGMGAVNAIYRTNFRALVVEDPIARAQAVADGRAGLGAFRKTEYLGDSVLVPLDDPDQVCSSDLLALTVNAAFADQHPKVTLAMNSVVQTLTNGQLLDLQRQVTADSPVDRVAESWLAARGIG